LLIRNLPSSDKALRGQPIGTILIRTRAIRLQGPRTIELGSGCWRVHINGVARILVIDDDENFRELLLTMLAGAGHVAFGAANGFEALNLFRATPSDLVLTDMVMPYSGLATIRILHEEFPEVGIIAMSGGGARRLDYARGLGAHQTLAKPFTAEQLAAAIALVLAAHPRPKSAA
jgi:CheY-like chemotaxis protein